MPNMICPIDRHFCYGKYCPLCIPDDGYLICGLSKLVFDIDDAVYAFKLFVSKEPVAKDTTK